MYTVKALIMDGVKIKGYRLLEDGQSETINIPEDKMIELIRDNKIHGADIVEEDGKEFITGLRLRDLVIASDNSVRMIDRLHNESGVIGYTMIDENNKERKISSKKAWNLGALGCIENGKAMYKRNKDGEVVKYLFFDDINIGETDGETEQVHS